MFLLPIKKLQNAGQQIETSHDVSRTLVYKFLAQTKLGSINLKPKAFEEVYFPSGAERSVAEGRIPNTNRFSNTNQCFEE